MAEKSFPAWVRVVRDFLVCCRVFFLTLAGSGLVGYFYGPENLEVKEFGFGAIRYVEVFFRGIPFSRVLASLFVASLLSLVDSVLPRPTGSDCATLDLGGVLPGYRGLGHGLFLIDRSLIRRLALRSSLSPSHVVGKN